MQEKGEERDEKRVVEKKVEARSILHLAVRRSATMLADRDEPVGSAQHLSRTLSLSFSLSIRLRRPLREGTSMAMKVGELELPSLSSLSLLRDLLSCDSYQATVFLALIRSIPSDAYMAFQGDGGQEESEKGKLKEKRR